MNPNNQASHPLDPAAAALPPEIEGALGDGDSLCACVVILVDSEIDRDWGAQASLAVSKCWAASGHRVILADGCLGSPVLHEAVGVENGEGVSDMVLFGASVTRITGRVENRLVLAPAGTPVVQITDVMKHVRWDMVIRGCREARATLVFHVSADTPGMEAMTERADGVVVLVPASKDVEALLGGSSHALIAVLGPGNGEPPFVPVEDERSELAVVDEPPDAPEGEDEDALPAEVSPGLEEDEEALSVEASPGLPEDEALSGFSVEDLAGSPAGEDEEEEDPDAFSMAELTGSQYEAEDSSGTGLGEEGDEEVATLEMDGEPIPVAAEISPETEGYDPEGASATFDDFSGDTGVAPADSSDFLADTGDAPADSDASLADAGDAPADSDDFSTDVGDPPVGLADVAADDGDAPVDLDDVPADLETLTDEVPFEIERTGIVDEGEEVVADLQSEAYASAEGDYGASAEGDYGASAEGDYGSIDLGVEESADVTAEAESPGPDPASDAPESEEQREAAVVEEAGEARRRYRGLARLERKRKRAVVARHFLTGVVTLLIAGGGGYAGAYFGLVNVPGITPLDRMRSYIAAPTDIPGPIPETAIMSHVLLIDSWRDEETAWSTAEALRSRLTDLLFFVTPMEIAGTEQFALHVGPAYNAVEAQALKEPVAVALDRLDPNDWEVREAPYAFFFGDYATAELAEARVQALAMVSVPTYWAGVTYPDGTVGTRVYGGAFPDEYQAAVFGRIIGDADVGETQLTARRGTLPE